MLMPFISAMTCSLWASLRSHLILPRLHAQLMISGMLLCLNDGLMWLVRLVNSLSRSRVQAAHRIFFEEWLPQKGKK